MAKKKKQITKKISSKRPCPKCGGQKWGLGYKHRASCPGTASPFKTKTSKKKVAKRSKKVVKRGNKPCPKCKGQKWGRGYKHRASCLKKAKTPKKKVVKKRAKKKAKKKASTVLREKLRAAVKVEKEAFARGRASRIAKRRAVAKKKEVIRKKAIARQTATRLKATVEKKAKAAKKKAAAKKKTAKKKAAKKRAAKKKAAKKKAAKKKAVKKKTKKKVKKQIGYWIRIGTKGRYIIKGSGRWSTRLVWARDRAHYLSERNKEVIYVLDAKNKIRAKYRSGVKIK